MNRKIVIGKFGQKLIFNRESKEACRSNTNGNVGAYKFFKLLIENNPDVIFVVLGDNDLNTFDKIPFDNVIDGFRMGLDSCLRDDIDFAICLIGLIDKDSSEGILERFINESNVKWLLVGDDPRCLETNYSFKNKPYSIILQFEGDMIFSDKNYKVSYIPIERASCYEEDLSGEYCKSKNITVIANTAGNYDRVGIVSNLIKYIDDVSVYGRVDEAVLNSNNKFKGEVSFNKINDIMKESKMSLLVPIKKGWVTSKYVECLMNDVLPIFYEDYNYKLLGIHKDDMCVVRNAQELQEVVAFYSNNEYERKHKIDFLKNKLLKQYSDGKILSNTIMSLLVK